MLLLFLGELGRLEEFPRGLRNGEQFLQLINFFFSISFLSTLKTCYEMERYLKEEPKLRSLQKLPSDLDTPWDIFASPSWNGESAVPQSPGHSSMWESSVSCSVVVKKEPLDVDYEDVALGCFEMDLLRSSYRENKRLKGKAGDTLIKTEPRSSRHGSSRGKKQHNQSVDSSSGSHSDSSSSSCSSRTLYLTQKGALLVQPKTESTSGERKTSRRSSCDESSDQTQILTPPSSPESVRNMAAHSEAELALLGHQGLIRVSTATAGIPQGAIIRLSTAMGHAKGATRSTTTAVAQRNANMPTSQASTSE